MKTELNMMPKVSVIVPVYNVEKYLQQCVDSLLAQTYKNIEIILVDDGAKDNSGKMCDELAQKDVRIKVVHKENQGLGYARNTGLEYATGEYVTFIDSDDYADVDLIEQLVVNIWENSADVCIGGFERVDNVGQSLFIEKYQHKCYCEDEVINNIFIKMFGSAPEKSDAIRMSVWNTLYSMKIIKEHNIKFPSEREFISEDIVFDTEYYPHVKKGVIVESIAYKYRVNPQSLTAKYMVDRLERVMKLYFELEQRIKKLNLGNEALYRLQRQTFVNIRVCIRQEKKAISHNRATKSISNIRRMCDLEGVQNIVAQYPVKLLPLKQKVFVKLIEGKHAKILYLMSLLGIV